MLKTLILSVAVPTALAVVLIGLAHRVWNRHASLASARWSLALAPGLGALLAYTVVKSFPELPPSTASLWPVWMAVFAGVVASATGWMERVPVALSLMIRAALSLAVPYLVLKPILSSTLEGSTGMLWVGGTGLAIFAVWTSIEVRAAKMSGPAVPVALTLLGTGVATVLGTSGTALLAQATGGATAAFGVMAALSLLRRDLHVSRSVAGPAALLFGGLLLAGIHYSEVQLLPAALLGVAALALWAGSVPALGRGIWTAAAAHAVVTLLVVGAAVGLSVTAGEEPEAAAASGGAEGEGAEETNGGTTSGYDEDYGYD